MFPRTAQEGGHGAQSLRPASPQPSFPWGAKAGTIGPPNPDLHAALSQVWGGTGRGPGMCPSSPLSRASWVLVTSLGSHVPGPLVVFRVGWPFG